MSCLHKIRFFVLTEPRTGSSLLGSLLATHPDICWGSHELKSAHWDRHYNPRLRKIFRHYPVPFLEYRARQTGKAAYGLKLMYHHLANANRMVPHLARLGWKVISLARRDLFAKTMSLMVSQQTGVWGHKKALKTATGSLRLPVDTFLHRLAAAQEAQAAHARLLAGVSHLDLVYEDHLADAGQWQATCAGVFQFLGLPATVVFTQMLKTWQRPYSELIANYDELVAAVENSSLARFTPNQG